MRKQRVSASLVYAGDSDWNFTFNSGVSADDRSGLFDLSLFKSVWLAASFDDRPVFANSRFNRRMFLQQGKNRRKTLILGGLYIAVFAVYF